MYCLRYSTAQQSVTVTSLGMFSTLRSSLYSTFLTFLGTRSTLAWSLYSMIFFSKGTYSILLSPLITSLPVFTVVPTTPEVVVQPPETAQLAVLVVQVFWAPEPVPQQVVVVVVGATQLEVVVVTGPWLTAQVAVLTAQALQPMGSPVFPSTSWLEDILTTIFKLKPVKSHQHKYQQILFEVTSSLFGSSLSFSSPFMISSIVVVPYSFS